LRVKFPNATILRQSDQWFARVLRPGYTLHFGAIYWQEFATDGTARALQRTFTGLVPGAFGMIDSGNLCDRINAFPISHHLRKKLPEHGVKGVRHGSVENELN
jgi:hypothetical protein